MLRRPPTAVLAGSIGLLGLVAVVGLVGLVGTIAAPPAAARDEVGAVVVADPRLSESSALAVSPDDPDLIYTVNDSGHAPVVYVVDRSGGASSRVVGTTALTGVKSPDLDPEALAVGADDTLFVADIGDNAVSRTDIALYALPAPGRGHAVVRPTRYPLTYPRGQRDDAEALLADPDSGAMWVATKGWFGGSVFEVPEQLTEQRPNRLSKVPDVATPLLVTDGTVLPDQDAAVLRTYVSAHVYSLPEWHRVGGFPLPHQPHGEALTALPVRGQLLAGTEGTPTRIDLVDVPSPLLAAVAAAGETSATSPSPTSGDGAAHDGHAAAGQESAQIWLGLGAAAVVLGAALAVAVRRRGR